MGTASSWEQFRNFPRLLQPLDPSSVFPPAHTKNVSMTLRNRRTHQACTSPIFLECTPRSDEKEREICLRRHGPKGVSAGAAGTQLLQKPALEAQGNPTLKPELLGPPPRILSKRSSSPSPLSASKNASPMRLMPTNRFFIHIWNSSRYCKPIVRFFGPRFRNGRWGAIAGACSPSRPESGILPYMGRLV